MRTTKAVIAIVCLCVIYYFAAWSWVEDAETFQLTGYLHVFMLLLCGAAAGIDEVIRLIRQNRLYRRLKNYHAEEVSDDTFSDS